MAATNINRVVMTGNLTHDPDLRATQSGLAICKLRVACNTRRKSASGDWEEKPNFFNVTVFGAQGENCSRYLSKGRPIALDGRLEWSEYTRDGQRRQSVDIIADSVQFLGGRDDAGGGNGGSRPEAASGSDVPIDSQDFQSAPAPAAPSDDDIPF